MLDRLPGGVPPSVVDDGAEAAAEPVPRVHRVPVLVPCCRPSTRTDAGEVLLGLLSLAGSTALLVLGRRRAVIEELDDRAVDETAIPEPAAITSHGRRPDWTRPDVAATFWELVSAAMLWINGAGFVKTKDEAWTEARAEASADVADVAASAAGAAWDGAKAIAGAPGAVLNAGKDAASTVATVLKVVGIGAD